MALRSRRPNIASSSRNCADWNPLEDSSRVRNDAKSIGDIVEGRTPVRRDDLHAFHAQVVEQLRQQLMLTAEASGLLLDPEATSYHLMDLAVERVVPWLEVLSQARGQGSAVLTRGEPKQLDRMAMLSSAEQMSAQLQNLQMRMDALSRAGHAAPQCRAGRDQRPRRRGVQPS